MLNMQAKAGLAQRLARPTSVRLAVPSALSRSARLPLRGSDSRRVTSVVRHAADENTSSAPPAADAPATAPPPAAEVDTKPEEVFYEGPGSNAELVVSLVLLPTLIYAPLSMASIGRRLWISFKFTNKRLVITNTSPLFKRTIEVAYKNIKEIRTAPRGFGLWGDMVVFLRDGSRLEITGIEKFKEIADHINRQIYTL